MLPKPFHLQLTAIYKAAPEGGFTSTFEELPDVFSEGETLEETKANHTLWHHPLSGKVAPVPRHREVKEGTIRAICRQLEIVRP